MVTHSNTHILFLRVKTGLSTTVACQDIVLSQHIDHNLLCRKGRQYLTQEIVGL